LQQFARGILIARRLNCAFISNLKIGGDSVSHSVRLRALIAALWSLVIAAIFLNAQAASADDRSALAAETRDLLKQRCFQCHGANGVARKNVFALDRNRLVQSKTVIPGDLNSLLLKQVESGAMPLGGPELSAEQKQTLRNWVARGAPDWEDERAIASRVFLTEPKLLALIRDDLLGARERDRAFLRYFSLAHLFNSGAPDDEMEIYRRALAKLVNSLSWHREITPPAAIDSAKIVFRIDLRDYNWTAATWNMIIAAYPYGLRTQASELISELSGAALPYIRADWFAANASTPPLYHDILALPKTARELERELGVDAARDLEEEKNIARAGLRSSGVSHNNRALERHASPQGAYWKSFDFKNNLDDQNIFKDPLRLNPAGGEIIFNLPNGLQAYLLIDAFGRRLDEAPIAIVADRNNADDPVIRNGRSCMNCHYDGMQSFKDDVRQVARSMNLASFDLEKVLAIYPAQETLDRLIEKDRARFQLAAQQTGGLATSAQAEPINALSRRFLAEMPVEQAAAEAGFEVREFQSRVAESNRLLALGYGQLLVARGGIKRDAWDKNFADLALELGLGRPTGSVIVLTRASQARAVNLSGAGSRAAPRAVGIGADPVSIMRSSRTIFIDSNTVFLKSEKLAVELQKRPEFQALGLAVVTDPKLADIRIELDRPPFTFTYAFTATSPELSLLLASGEIVAWDGNFAAPKIAKEILKRIEAARKASR
jgi:mono/diheme cytochrome c family protein